MTPNLAGTLVLTALLIPSGASRLDSARPFLVSAFGLSTAEIARLDRGDVVSRTLAVTNRREVATLGIVRITTSPENYVGRLSDIATFKRSADVLQVGTFSRAPEPADVSALTIDERDLRQLRGCRVESCDVRLSAEAIERIQREIDWRAADAEEHASRLMRQFLVEYVARYQERGAKAAMEYADRAPRLNAGREFASLLDDDTILPRYAPRLRRHLLDYPESAENVSDFVYWSKELVRRRPVVSITHVATAAANEDSPMAYVIASKQIYAAHYFDASLGLTLLVPDRTAPSPAMYVVYLNRSRVDLFDGVFGGVVRRMVAGRARTLIAEQLQRLQRTLASTPAPPREPSPDGR